MLQVHIPSVGPEAAESERNLEKGHMVFRVEVLCNGRKHTIYRRYSEFHALHKQIKKSCKVPDFPPKRVPNWRHKVLEQRRQGLEAYIQGVLYLNQEVPKEVLEFLKLRHFPSDSKASDMDSLGKFLPSNSSAHQPHRPVLKFHRDPYLQSPSLELIPNMVVSGVLQGLYSCSRCPRVAQPKDPYFVPPHDS
ncbi:sorting nexin-22 isoform X2 [Gracilinanus agilis]|uniref:sorting nexin-22 isoform X2 n=1 Tax=Gracilinanus agilis TaxID=191870 RepID=UPI001CFDC8E6|nr:sorting nexin-22 isoform X2 [Gracilinanus agilis]